MDQLDQLDPLDCIDRRAWFLAVMRCNQSGCELNGPQTINFGPAIVRLDFLMAQRCFKRNGEGRMGYGGIMCAVQWGNVVGVGEEESNIVCVRVSE